MPVHITALVRNQLSAWFGQSIYKALVLVVFAGLALPAMFGSYLLVGVKEERAARLVLNEALQRYADILALGMQEPLWIMNPETAQPLIESVMRDPAVLQIRVLDQAKSQFINTTAPARTMGNVISAEREIIAHGQQIGWISIEMDDAKSQAELRDKQWSYALILALQLLVSLCLIVLFLHTRLMAPLKKLMVSSDRLSQGDFDTSLDLGKQDELGRLAQQLEQMRVAIRKLFADIGQREERFRSIVTQAPGAVFRVKPNGPIEFVSDRIEEICGYSAAVLMAGSVRSWANIICAEDRVMQKQRVKEGLRFHKRYEIEYRIVDAAGQERWISECGQPEYGEDGEIAFIDGIITDITERKQNEMRIAALLSEQSAILDNVMLGIAFVRERNIISANRFCEHMFGFAEHGMHGLSCLSLLPAEGGAAQLDAQFEALQHGGLQNELLCRRADGSLFWCQVNVCALDAQQAEAGSIWVFADISERQQAEEKLRLAATVFDYIADGVIVTDAQSRIVAVNPAFTQITGFAEQEALGQTPGILRSGRQEAAFYDALWRELLATGFWRGEIWNRRKNQELYLEWLTISAVKNSEGVSTHYVGVFSDITQVKESQEKLDHLAHHDPLTGLPNRLLFSDRLAHAIQLAQREHRPLALLFIDLDRFKSVNDTLGHHIGDEMLRQVAQALSAKVRDGDTLARLGGDEFVLLLEDSGGKYGAGVVAEKLMAIFEQPFYVASHELFASCSIGVAIYPDDGEDLNILIRNADVALYQAKADGRNAYRYFSPEMTGEGVERLRLENLLRRSIEKSEIFLNYQPQIDLTSGQLIGLEALVRWQHPELGLVSPARFIPVAEDTGFINQLGKWVLFEACRQMVRWQELGFYAPKMAVNLSVKQFERGGMAQQVREILQETGLQAARLQLEVTESVIMHTGDALRYIGELHEIGVQLAIDDFGTGYSSLSYLKRMPVQALKIDRSFIKDIGENPDEEAIAIAVIQLGKSLHLSVIAEGVETAQQVAFLQREGCQLAQGFFFSKPLTADQIFQQWGANPAPSADVIEPA
ncbi:EAL domain-containing protein [Massilia sp. W12]|uniref:EAL domain-containing protein n=1 Tax=Massilia sp. W12 TaxID=3126507 RepID=UPI0030CF3F7D